MTTSAGNAQPGRLEMPDLVAAAARAGFEIKPRLITDWASLGLLDQPDARGRGRGKGKSYTWPREQAGLLVALLNKRKEGVGRIALLNVPIATWLIWGDRYTPLRQARRALATWARSNLRVGPEKVGRTLRDTLKRLDHPDATPTDRRELRTLMQTIAYGQPYNSADLVTRIRRVMDPHESGLARGLPEGAVLSPELYAETIESRLCGTRHAERDDLGDNTWYHARNIYLAQGPVAPFLAELRRPNASGILTPAAHARFEYALNGAGHHLVQILGQLSCNSSTTTRTTSDPDHQLAPATAGTARGHGTRKVEAFRMQAHPTEPARDGICVAHGYGLKISVHRGHLIVHDGIGRDRRTRRYHRVTSKLHRLVIIGHTGYITLDALRWIHDAGATLLHIDADGQLLTTLAMTGPSHGALRRAQALSATSAAGVEIARQLLRSKVAGQRSLLPELPGGHAATEVIDRALRDIDQARDLTKLIGAEAQAASAYWGAWSNLPILIGGRGTDSLPEHWLTFGQRHSLLSNGPPQACNPPNAVLNYLYALLEAETTVALHAVGLDPTLGIFHTDQRNRASLALDAMEAVRPKVDAYVLALLTQRTHSREDFAETRQGACRITPQLAIRLASTISAWRHHIAPVAEGIAQGLAGAGPTTIAISAPLTRAQHAAAWDTRAPDRKPRQARAPTLALPNACNDCGTHVPDRRRRYCEQCRRERWAKHASAGRDSAAAVLGRLRAEQQDPAHGGRPGQIRGQKNAAHQRAVRDWTGERPDPQLFRSEILPGIREIPIGELVASTGLSEHYCSLIRLGKKVPHARHWKAFTETATSAHEPRQESLAEGRINE